MKKTKDKPPASAARLLAVMNRSEDRLTIQSDFAEIFEELTREQGRTKALHWYWTQVARSFPLFIVKGLYWRFVMLKNYIKITLRNIRRHKGYSFINIGGLAVGFACCLLIGIWILNELSFDSFHADVDRIYHVIAHTDYENVTVPTLLGPTLEEEFPEIVETARFHGFYGGTILSYRDKIFYEDRLRIADPSLFRIFTFPFIQGDAGTCLDDPYSIVISRSTAGKYFGTEDPMGKTLILNREQAFAVTGIFEDVPANSTLQFDMLVPMSYRIATAGDWYTRWNNYNPYTFAKLGPNVDVEELNRKIEDVIPAHGGDEGDKLSLLSFRERHFHFYADITLVYFFAATAIFILMIACFNFINLSTARSANRAKEIGMRKITGALRTQIVIQFLGESLLFTFMAVAGAFLLVALLLPSLSRLSSSTLTISYGTLLPLAAVLALVTGITAGLYPAFILSGFQPVKMLKGTLRSGSKNPRLRKFLVVIQFSLSILLIVSVLVVYQQLDFIRGKNIGYNRSQLVKIAMRGGSQQHYDELKRELMKNSRVLDMTATQASLPYLSWHQGGFHWEGKEPDKSIEVSHNTVNYDFVTTFQLDLVEGRDYSRDFVSDVETAFLVNEAMVKLMGLKTAAGAKLSQGDHSRTIIGVVKDFNFHTLNKGIEPLVLRLDPTTANNVYIRISPGPVSSTLDFIRETWERIAPDYPFAYRFVDEEFAEGYRSLERAGSLLKRFAILAVFISCLGLFGLVSFTAEQRTKEVGIRKVLGSSVAEIMVLLTREYTIRILWASLIACPMAYWLMNRWLKSFVFRTEIGWGVFIVAVAGTLTIAMLTVSFQAIKAARADPVDALHYE